MSCSRILLENSQQLSWNNFIVGEFVELKNYYAIILVFRFSWIIVKIPTRTSWKMYNIRWLIDLNGNHMKTCNSFQKTSENNGVGIPNFFFVKNSCKNIPTVLFILEISILISLTNSESKALSRAITGTQQEYFAGCTQQE